MRLCGRAERRQVDRTGAALRVAAAVELQVSSDVRERDERMAENGCENGIVAGTRR